MHNELIVYHHLGLGDHFICNGLVNKLSESCDKLYLMCKSNNYETVRCLYEDNNIIDVVKIYDENTDIKLFEKFKNINITLVGFSDFNNKTFDQSFYTNIGLDFSIRYSYFKLPTNKTNSEFLFNKLQLKEPYIVIHCESSECNYNLNINSNFNKFYIKRSITNNLLDYIDIINNASEIHCIDSSVYHLVDSLKLSSKLYFHNVRNSQHNKIRVSDKWTIV